MQVHRTSGRFCKKLAEALWAPDGARKPLLCPGQVSCMADVCLCRHDLPLSPHVYLLLNPMSTHCSTPMSTYRSTARPPARHSPPPPLPTPPSTWPLLTRTGPQGHHEAVVYPFCMANSDWCTAAEMPPQKIGMLFYRLLTPWIETVPDSVDGILRFARLASAPNSVFGPFAGSAQSRIQVCCHRM